MEALKSLIESLRKAGVNVEEVAVEIDQERHDHVLSKVQEREALHPLVEAVKTWIGYFENMQDEWEEWCELNRMEC